MKTVRTERKGFVSQKDKVLAHLKNGKRISALEAIKYFGAMRLSAIIHELRKDGFYIVSKRKVDPTGQAYVSYRMA